MSLLPLVVCGSMRWAADNWTKPESWWPQCCCLLRASQAQSVYIDSVHHLGSRERFLTLWDACLGMRSGHRSFSMGISGSVCSDQEFELGNADDKNPWFSCCCCFLGVPWVHLWRSRSCSGDLAVVWLPRSCQWILFRFYPLYIGTSVCVLSGVQLCNPIDCSLPDSCVHGISQPRILE